MTAGRPGRPAPAAYTERQWCVYRCYDAADQLVYIGSTGDVENRIYSHFSPGACPTSLALQRVYDHHTVTHFASKDEALEAERAAIITEAPLLNRAHNVRRWRYFEKRWIQLDPILPADGVDTALHGTASTYVNRSCRCEPCRKANAERERRRRLERAA